MNFKKFINSDYLKENPLCGIGTYKDELNLATGACTRQIKKFIFTGEENWKKENNSNYTFEYNPSFRIINGLCSHYAKYYAPNIDKIDGIYLSNTNAFIITDLRFTTLTDFKAYLAAQYDAGTPITVWYVLATPTTETITVPSGLSGTEEGYLNQSGAPTPTNPIYPTANTVEKWFDINHYIMGTPTDTIATLPAVLYADGNNATVGISGNMSQTGTPTPTTPIQPQETGDLETEGAKAGQYKIPISSANATTPVYLGEVQTTRKVQKLVLTGGDDENWSSTTIETDDYIYRMELSDLPKSGVAPICTHYTGSTATRWVNIADYEVTTSIINSVAIRHSGLTGVSDWKSYLQQQYAAGTPVTVWYVLATEETGIVNEPLRKIGDYADTVSGISIPTIAGANTLSVDTTLQPSEVTATYKGWHPVADVHEKSRNLFDKSTVINGKRIDAEGEPFDSETCSLSQFIKVTPSSVINQGYNFSYNDCMAEYDINKAFIARHVSGNGVVTLDNSTHYIRVAVSTSRLDSVMVNEGSTSLPYEPYWT